MILPLTSLAFAHLDLCFRLHTQGLDLVYTPHAVAGIEQVSMPGPALLQAAEQDRRLLQERWQQKLRAGDPWYNPAMLAAHGLDQASFTAWLLG